MKTETIWAAYAPSLYFFILKRTGDRIVAQDVLQNTFLKIHQHLNSLQDTTKIKPWAFQIARNELSNYYRRAANDSVDELINSQETSSKDDFCCFDDFIGDLPKKYKEVVELTYLEGKTNSEVADRLGISLSNVKARIRRAKNMLKQRFQECCRYTMNESGKLVGEPDCAVCNNR